MFRLKICSMSKRSTCHMYVHINTRTQIPLDTYKQVYHQTEIRLNYAKCYNLREILLICVRSNMSNILFNQATFHAIGQDPFLAWPVSIKPSFLGYWNPKNVSKLVFLLRHLHKNRHWRNGAVKLMIYGPRRPIYKVLPHAEPYQPMLK